MAGVESPQTADRPMATPAVPEKLIAAVRSMRRPVVAAHVVPDADALGAMLGLARALAGDGCTARIALPEGSVSRRLAFMVDFAAVPIASPDDFAQADGFITVDTAKKPRCNVGKKLKDTDWTAGRPVINIDHHNTSTRFGDVNWVVDEAGSSCELIFYLLTEMALPIDRVTASLLYAGIQTDTVGFSLPTTRAWALLAAARLVQAGADVAGIGRRLYHSLHPSEFALLRVIYANTKSAADGQIAYSSASYDEIHGAGCTAADIDDQINVPRSLAGARLAMLFTEGNRGKTRVNFRSGGDLTIADLAADFKGGGHAQSAGAILDCGLREAMDRVVPRAVEYLRSSVTGRVPAPDSQSS